MHSRTAAGIDSSSITMKRILPTLNRIFSGIWTSIWSTIRILFIIYFPPFSKVRLLSHYSTPWIAPNITVLLSQELLQHFPKQSSRQPNAIHTSSHCSLVSWSWPHLFTSYLSNLVLLSLCPLPRRLAWPLQSSMYWNHFAWAQSVNPQKVMKHMRTCTSNSLQGSLLSVKICEL